MNTVLPGSRKSPYNNHLVTKLYTGPWKWTDSSERSRKRLINWYWLYMKHARQAFV